MSWWLGLLALGGWALVGWLGLNFFIAGLSGATLSQWSKHDREVDKQRREREQQEAEKAARRLKRLEKRAAELGCTVEDLLPKPVTFTPCVPAEEIVEYVMFGVFDEENGVFVQRGKFRGRWLTDGRFQFFQTHSGTEEFINVTYNSREELYEDLRTFTTFHGKKMGYQTRKTLYSEPGSDWSAPVPAEECDRPAVEITRVR